MHRNFTMKENKNIKAFKESLKKINKDEFLKLVKEIDAEPQNETEMTYSEFLKKANSTYTEIPVRLINKNSPSSLRIPEFI